MNPPRLEADIVLARARKTINDDAGLTPAGREKFLSGIVVYAERGYYRDSMGVKGVNDAGIWDDAAWIIDFTNNDVIPFRWNTDPSRFGWNEAIGKSFAILQPGVWPFRKGQHKMKGAAWRQLTDDEANVNNLSAMFSDHRKDGTFRVWRGAVGGKSEISYQAINIHWGASYGTSSWGCQTSPPETWDQFRDLTYALTKRVKQSILPYILAHA
jgi:hypothetical protein